MFRSASRRWRPVPHDVTRFSVPDLSFDTRWFAAPIILVLAADHVIQDGLVCVGDGKAKKDRNKVGSI